jgi:NitT/TauT family transport system permease protein
MRLAPGLGVLAFLSAWQLGSLAYPEFILPGPARVAAVFAERTLDGTLFKHTLTTLSEAVPGLLAGLVAAFAFGYPIARSRFAERLLSPFVVASQGIPLVAVAPLLFIWFGDGFLAKVLVCTLIVFFPILINVIAGLRQVPPQLVDLFRLHGASRRDFFTKLELPATLPYLFAGLRTGGTLAMIGALTGEFISPNRARHLRVHTRRGKHGHPPVIVRTTH